MMSDINLLARLNNLWKGFVSIWVSDVEKEHPEIAYENSINNLITNYSKQKNAAAAIIRRRDEIRGRLDAATRQQKDIGTQLEAALKTSQDDVAVVLIQQKNGVETTLAELAVEAQQAEKDAQDVKDGLLSTQSRIQQLKAERDRNLAKFHSAQARVQIQEQLDGLSVDAEVRALDTVREHIGNMVAKANLGQELRETDLTVRLQKLSNQTGEITARAQLEEMKRARAAAAAGTGEARRM
jgi:phage shock protein A